MGIFTGILLLASAAAQANPTCEVEGRQFQLVLETGSRIPISSADFLRLARSAECIAPAKPYDCSISLTRTNLNERYGNHCKLIENSPASFDYYSLSMAGQDNELFGTGTCYKVECVYGGEGGGRRMVYDNKSYCMDKPSEAALEKLALMKQLGFCKASP